ncbi:unnamed protein product [Cunninghamella echinulata]
MQTEEPLYFPGTTTESIPLSHPPIIHDDDDNDNKDNVKSIIVNEKNNDLSTSTMFMKRSSLSKAERRAEHNAIERARRENLNGKFQQLAESLPNLQSYRRPSKGQIVEKALDWVKQTVVKEERYQYQIHQLERENKRLLMQLNMSQQQQQQPSSSSSSSSPCHLHSNQQSPIPISQHYSPQNNNNNNNNHIHSINNHNHNHTDNNTLDESIHPFMIPPPPQLITSPYSIGTNSRRGSAIVDEDEDPDFIMDHQTSSQVPIMPTSTTPIPNDFYFYNDIVTANTTSMDTNWSKMNFFSTFNQRLIHPTEMPL